MPKQASPESPKPSHRTPDGIAVFGVKYWCPAIMGGLAEIPESANLVSVQNIRPDFPEQSHRSGDQRGVTTRWLVQGDDRHPGGHKVRCHHARAFEADHADAVVLGFGRP